MVSEEHGVVCHGRQRASVGLVFILVLRMLLLVQLLVLWGGKAFLQGRGEKLRVMVSCSLGGPEGQGANRPNGPRATLLPPSVPSPFLY